MADEQNEVRRVDWNTLFSFTHVFKSFRMAIHPSKLILSLAAIVLVFVTGHVMDAIWSIGNDYVRPGEIRDHIRLPAAEFDQQTEDWQAARLEAAAALLAEARRERRNLSDYRVLLGSTSTHLAAAFGEQLRAENTREDTDEKYEEADAKKILDDAKEKKLSWTALLGQARDVTDKEIDKIEKVLAAAQKPAEDAVAALKDEQEKDKAEQALRKHLGLARQMLTQRKVRAGAKVVAIRGERIFAGFLEHEWTCIRSAISAVRYGNFTTGLKDYQDIRRNRAIEPAAITPPPVAGGADLFKSPAPADDPPGFLYWVLMGVHGVGWLLGEHTAYGIIFLAISLAICALFGGAVHRIAALHFAREEKISMAQALKFSTGKFFSYFTAPLIPLAIIFLIGLFLFAGGLVGNIPYVGEVLMGVLFFLAIIGGLVVAFLLIGLVTGCGLMYPTIAVEGSDSFDAISRSFSYVFAKPWRAILYALVALVHGTICYLFVRLFAFLALAATHCFVGCGVFGGGQALGPDADKLDVMWSAPGFNALLKPFSWSAMNTTETIGALFIWIWVFLVAGLVLAFLLSYFASGTTVIYYLLRRRVDATDLDDVYVEEAEEEPPFGTEAEPPGEQETAPEAEAGEPGDQEKPADQGPEDEDKDKGDT